MGGAHSATCCAGCPTERTADFKAEGTLGQGFGEGEVTPAFFNEQPLESEPVPPTTYENPEHNGPPRLVVVPGDEHKVDGRAEFVPVLVEVQPPVGSVRRPADICVIIDISKSMGAEAHIQAADGQVQSHGLSLLDVAKHAVSTIIATLGPSDRLCLVWFNHQAGQVLKLTKMDQAGKDMASKQLLALGETGSTNIWLGLECGLNSLREDTTSERMGHILLLTDGCTVERGTVMSNLVNYKQQHEQLPGTLSTFGFGYKIDSMLLTEISSFGDATFSFIPDPGFVGTVFVNTLSNLLVTFAKEVVIQLEATNCEIKSVRGQYKAEITSECTRIRLGTLQYQQVRSVVVAVKPTTATNAAIGASITYQANGKETKESEFVEVPLRPGDSAAVRHVTAQMLRCFFIEALCEVVNLMLHRGTEVSEQADSKNDAQESGLAAPKAAQNAYGCGGKIKEWTITLRKHDDLPLGLNVDFIDECVCVLAINPGLVRDWNTEHPDEAVELEDCIIEVNGVRGEASDLVALCKKDDMLDLLVIRLSEEAHKQRKDYLARAQKQIKKFVKAILRSAAAGDDFIQILHEDATGQSTEAVSRLEWYKKWGCHYMPSLRFAHQMQQCNNFKDPGVQNYGGKLFKDIREQADSKFNSLPPPEPSVRNATPSGSATTASGGAYYYDMSYYNNPSAG